MGKFLKYLFIFFFLLIVFVVGAAILIPIFYKDEVVKVVKEQINSSIKAKVDFDDVELSLFKSFPDLNIDLQNLKVENVAPFSGTKLYAAQSTQLSVDIWSVIKYEEGLELNSIYLNEPNITVKVLPDGTANYDIALESDEPAAETDMSGFRVALQKYEIENGNITYDDQSGGIFLNIKELNHEGKGDFTLDVVELATETKVSQLTFAQAGTNYLNKAKLDADIDLVLDLKNANYIFKKGDVLINALPLNIEGQIGLPNESDIALDLKFASPGSNFKEVFSLLPGAYTSDFNNVKANGSFKLNGFVNGKYNEQTMPKFGLDLTVDNGSVQYPDLPLSINTVHADVNVKSSDAKMRDLVVNLPNFAFNVGNNPVKGKLSASNLMNDPYVDADIDADLKLEDLAKAYPMEDIKDLKGQLRADVTFKGKQSDIDAGNYTATDVKGSIDLNDFVVQSGSYPKSEIKEMHMQFSPQQVTVPNFTAQLGRSDLSGNAKFDNILAYFEPGDVLRGEVNIRSKYLDADEWMTEETTDESTSVESSEAPFDRFDIVVDAAANMIKYDTYTLKNAKLKGHATSNALTIDELATEINDSDVSMNGKIDNLMNYLYNNGTLSGTVNVNSSYLDLNPFMVTEEAAASEETPTEGVFLVPDHMNLTVNTNAKKVKYTDMDLTNVKGVISVSNEEASIKKMDANLLGGRVDINGVYNTKDHANPSFKMGFDLANMDFQKMFNQFNTFQKLAPIGKFITGKFNTSLNMDGLLGEDMMPKLESITADGFLATLDAAVKSLPALEKAGNLLNVNELRGIDLSNTKNWVTIENGKVELKPVDYAFQGIDMNVSGFHTLANDMNYNLKTKIPRDKINQTAVGAAANTGLDLLSGQAKKLGLNLDAGDNIDVLLNITGSIANPKVSVKLLDVGQSAGGLKDQVVDAAKNKLNEEKEKLQKEAEERLQEEREKLQAEVERRADSIRQEAENRVKEVVEEKTEEVKEEIKDKVSDEITKQVEDKLGEEAKNAIDDAKDKLKDLNPFKKKKD